MHAPHDKNRLAVLPHVKPSTKASRRRWSLAACILSSIALFSGCAKNPPSSTSSLAISGKQLAVTMQFRNSVNPNYYYYFLINYDTTLGGTVGNQSAPGPIPVVPGVFPPGGGFGNGFACGSNGRTTDGFTDFVEFHGGQYQLFHVIPNTNLQQFVLEPMGPITFTLPGNSQNNNNTLQFAIDLSQIVVDSHGGMLDPTQTKTTALNIQWLQVNIVATNTVSIVQTPGIIKQVDSLGNNVLSQGNTYATLQLNQIGRVYTNADAALLELTSPEPDSNDVYTSDGSGGDESLDLLPNYTIAITQQSQ